MRLVNKLLLFGWLSPFLLLFLSCSGEVQLLSLTDQNRIELAVDRLEKAIQKTDTSKAFSLLPNQISVAGDEIHVRARVRSIFKRAEDRKTMIPAPPRAGKRRLWDFEITDLDVEFNQERTEAFVHCKLKLWAGDGNISQGAKQSVEKLRFSRVGDGWRLVSFENLLHFLESEVRTDAAE